MLFNEDSDSDAEIENVEGVAKMLIDAGANQNQDVMNPNASERFLKICRNYDKLDQARQDLDSLENINHKSVKDGSTALHIIVQYELQVDFANEIIAKGADLNLTDDDGKSALINACRNRNEDHALNLIEKGADIHIQAHPDIGSALILAAINSMGVVALKLIEKDADINLMDSAERSLLEIIANTDYELMKEVFEVLIQKGA